MEAICLHLAYETYPEIVKMILRSGTEFCMVAMLGYTKRADNRLTRLNPGCDARFRNFMKKIRRESVSRFLTWRISLAVSVETTDPREIPRRAGPTLLIERARWAGL